MDHLYLGRKFLADENSLALRRLQSWAENSTGLNIGYLCVCIALVLASGTMSGLTLGLLSLDKVDIEVLKRSGSERERIFLDKLVNEVIAIVVSVTLVLAFGEIIPQSICARHGLAIGAFLAWPVRILMWVCSPISWPVGKLLDLLLGAEHLGLFRRKQLKALVDLHGADEGLGGRLSDDEVKIICGALDLTNKIAYKGMTPLDKVFMLSTDDKLDGPTLKAILDSGHSRIPVYHSTYRTAIVGLVLVKELIQYGGQEVPISSLKLRSMPRLSATTAMYDMLKLFQTGRAHMAVLTQPDLEAEHNQQQLAGLAGDASHRPKAVVLQSASSFGAQPTTNGAVHPPGNALMHSTSNITMTEPEIVSLPTVSASTTLGHHQPVLAVPSKALTDMSQPVEHVVPLMAQPGEPIGIITIEDVIEELMGLEILDETDYYADNERTIRVNDDIVAQMAQNLPDRLKRYVLNTNLKGVLAGARRDSRNVELLKRSGGPAAVPLLQMGIGAPASSADGTAPTSADTTAATGNKGMSKNNSRVGISTLFAATNGDNAPTSSSPTKPT